MRSVHILLHGLIDYAGLFPPAGLGMSEAAANYAAYRSGDTCWALGRFVAPAARLAELEAAPGFVAARGAWKVAALAGADLAADLAAIDGFNRRHAGRAAVDTIELKAGAPGDITDVLDAIDGRLEAYVELPLASDPAPLLRTLRERGGRAKARTGGVTADAFPAPRALLRFLEASIEADVPFKLTAGLHHPLRGRYRLTYEPDSACAMMYGFLNVFLAAAFLSRGLSRSDALALIEESEPDRFRFEDEGVAWRSHWLDHAELRHARRGVAMAFGSCSFREPIDDLRALGLL